LIVCGNGLKKEIDPGNPETWVVSHTCHQGHLRCGNPAHLFLATNSVNQRQRQCPAAGVQPCPNCFHVPVCTCNQLANRAMANGSTPPCVPPTVVGISPLQQQINASQQANTQLQQQLHTQGNLVEALRKRITALESSTTSPSSPAKRRLT